MWVVKQLGSPLRYLQIKQGSGIFTSKLTYDLIIPVFISLILTIVMWWFSLSLGLFATEGFIPSIINLLNLLIAFFIAALAAVATFDRPGLDDRLKGEPATMRRRNDKDVVRDHVLSHRQFICYLFGYLSFSSIVLLLTLYGVRLVGHETVAPINLTLSLWGLVFHLSILLRSVGIFVFFFFFTQIVINMLLGIYFLSDRLQFLNDPND